MSRVLASKQTTLEEAVAACVVGGMTDPVEIVTKLSTEMGQPWLLRQLVNVVALLAQKGGGGQTRRDLKIVRPPSRAPGVPRVQRAASGNSFEDLYWVSADVGWKPLRDLTASDCREIADGYSRLAAAAERHRTWFRETARAMEKANASSVWEIRDRVVALAARDVRVLPQGVEAET